jgi:hypothetical protein
MHNPVAPDAPIGAYAQVGYRLAGGGMGTLRIFIVGEGVYTPSGALFTSHNPIGLDDARQGTHPLPYNTAHPRLTFPPPPFKMI